MPNRPAEVARRPPDAALWQETIRGVEPLRHRRPSSAPAPAILPQAAVLDKGSPPRPAAPLDRFAGIDRATAERLKRGLRKIEARLDLHGMTQKEAHRALVEFLREADDAGRRCLLVITGRGLGVDGPGILQGSVPRWLAEGGLRQRILAIAPAQPRHGGAGALYVLLRRRY
jgi:DNA-nicking Smr family endonuclease